jgi:peptidoglycan-associated lipoprotein
MKLAFAGAALVACASQTTTTSSASLPPPNAEYSPSWPTLGRGVERFITIQLGPDALEQCRNVSPKFPFDSATADVEDQDQLAALVRCLNHETMQSRSVLLVGRADPRGTDAYNMELGTKRVEHIRDFLVREGLDPSRITTDSGGKRDARGSLPDYSFGYDRRVDVVVLGAHHL